MFLEGFHRKLVHIELSLPRTHIQKTFDLYYVSSTYMIAKYASLQQFRGGLMTSRPLKDISGAEKKAKKMFSDISTYVLV